MEFRDQVKAAADIVRTVSEYVRLKKAGARYTGLCPFHTEKTPSFNVNPTLGIFICFGCGMKGDVFKFVQEIEHLTFWEALKLLAERNGIPIPKQRRETDAETQLRAAIYEMHELAARIFETNLRGANAAPVRDYLARRGVTPMLAGQFGVGYAERSGQELLRHLRKDFTPDQIEASGLAGRRDDGSLYDRFRGRLMFPIHNESGKVIAFGGRALSDEDQPKYLNSPETAIYKKTHVLYNFHRAKEAIRKSGGAVLVEGYMDVIGVYGAGVKQVVASCGTALTSQQVRAMKRHSEHAVVNFDPDNAGANAAERSIQMMLEEGMHVRVLELAGGLDPDEYVKKFGAADYVSRLQGASRFYIWLADRARRKYDMQSAEGRIEGYEAVMLPAIRRISDKLEQAAVAAEVASYLGIDAATVRKEFRKNGAPRESRPAVQQAVPPAERALVRSLLASGEARDVLAAPLASSDAARGFAVWPIVEAILDLARDGEEITFENVDARLDDQRKTLLSTLIFADNTEEIFGREQALAYVKLLEAEEHKRRLAALRLQLKSAERAGNSAEAFRCMHELEELQKRQKT